MIDEPTSPQRAAAQAHTAVPPERIAELFGLQPPSWIRPVLTLASPITTDTGQGNPSFTLGEPAADERGTVVVPLTWYPARGARTFSRFDGHFTIAPAARGTIIALDGSVEGGEAPDNRAALQAVLRQVVRALEAVYPGDGG